MNEMTKEGWMAFTAIVLLLIIIIIGIIVFYTKDLDKRPRKDFRENTQKSQQVQKEDKRTNEFIDKAVDAAFVKEKPKNEYAQNTQTQAVSYAYKAQEVEIALIIEENEYDVKNIISGACGDVYMVTAYVPGPQVLTNSLKALFGDKVFGDFMPGNIIPSYHPNLTFKEVKIENGVAKVYLGGSFSGSREGVCDATLAIAQIKETAKSYPNVKSVEIYQGGEKID